MNINSRRYLGNKYKLLPFITATAKRHCPGIESVADIFAGTGSVAYNFIGKRLITNDILYSNYICHLAWFSPEQADFAKIESILQFYNAAEAKEDNYMSINFSGTYFSRSVCRKIGFIREHIEGIYARHEINSRERAILITSLLYAMDKIACTCGHYDAYRKNASLPETMLLEAPAAQNGLDSGNKCYNMDANSLVRNIYADLVYIDPPYNSRQYCDAYHLLENVALWQKPALKGTAKKMPRAALKSRYCTLGAAEAFADLIKNINAKYIMFSYNNMAKKGNGRSNARISDKDIMLILSEKGKVSVFSQKYKPFSAGKSKISGHRERLFLCEVKK